MLPTKYFVTKEWLGVRRDSSVGLVTRYGLDGPGIESRGGAKLSATVQTLPGAHPVSGTKGIGAFYCIK